MAGSSRISQGIWGAIRACLGGLGSDSEFNKLVDDVEVLRAAVSASLGNGVQAIATIVISATPEDFKTTTTAYYTLAGIQYSKAAADNISFSAADTINVGTAVGDFFGSWLVQVDSAGTVTTKPAGGLSDQVYTSADLAEAALPAVDAGNVQLGYITIGATTDSAWTANTDDMTPASDCQTSTFNDVALTHAVAAATVDAAGDMTAGKINP
jgi:hypothetical protein